MNPSRPPESLKGPRITAGISDRDCAALTELEERLGAYHLTAIRKPSPN